MYTDVLPREKYSQAEVVPAMIRRHQKMFTFAREDTLCYLSVEKSFIRAMHIIDKVTFVILSTTEKEGSSKRWEIDCAWLVAT